MHRQRGFSPVEILIGLVLTLLVVGGVAQMVTGSRAATLAERNLSALHEAGRIGSEVIARELRKAGFRTERVLSDDLVFPADATFAAAGAVVVGSDVTVTQRYIGSGDTWMRDCLGNAVAAGAMVIQTWGVQTGSLYCEVRNPSTAAVQRRTLVGNVDAIQLRYGVSADGDQYADSYLSAAQVTDWTSVVSVDIRLRAVSTDDGLMPEPQPYLAFDGSVVTPSDRRLRRTYATVVALRNRLP